MSRSEAALSFAQLLPRRSFMQAHSGPPLIMVQNMPRAGTAAISTQDCAIEHHVGHPVFSLMFNTVQVLPPSWSVKPALAAGIPSGPCAAT